jgi:hypothetical protein
MELVDCVYIKRDTEWPIGLSFGPLTHLNLGIANGPDDSPFKFFNVPELLLVPQGC